MIKNSVNWATFQKNRIWAGAMNLAWNQFSAITGEDDLLLQVSDKKAKQTMKIFNQHLFTKNDLSQDSYYIKVGTGPQAIQQINSECKAKFPKKKIEPLKFKLNKGDIISYAYLFKSVTYLSPFDKKQGFLFGQTKVKAFEAKSLQSKRNILVHAYQSPQKFVIQLLLKNKNDRLVIALGYNEIPLNIYKQNIYGHPLDNKDEFCMPVLDLKVTRDYKQMLNLPILNQKLKGFHISVMSEVIKLVLNHQGAKVQNQAKIVVTKSLKFRNYKLFVNKPFWLIMGQKDKHPYIMAHIADTTFMIK